MKNKKEEGAGRRRKRIWMDVSRIRELEGKGLERSSIEEIAVADY